MKDKIVVQHQLNEIYNSLNAIAETSSRKSKEMLLLALKDNETILEVLKFLYDPMVVTGISSKKIHKELDLEPSFYPITLLDCLVYIKLNNTGTDKDIATLQTFINVHADEDYMVDFLEKIFTKSLNLGIDVKTLQKVYGKDFIPTLDVMLGTSIEHVTIPDGAWFSISQKLNGNRCFYYKGKLYTRQGKEYTGCEHILKDLVTIENAYYPDYVFDGELILEEIGLSDSAAFQKGTGIANSKDKDKSNLKLIIFDLLPRVEFESGVSTKTYAQRKIMLTNLRRQIYNHGLDNIKLVQFFYEGNDQKEIFKWLDYAECNDMEGVMINLDAPYQCKRTKDLVKVKKFYTYDLLVVGVEEGTGRNKGRLGAVKVQFRDNIVSVGSGFSDEQRDAFWDNPSLIVGSVIEVKYKEVTKNKDTGAESLQFPVFMGIREAGKEVSYE